MSTQSNERYLPFRARPDDPSQRPADSGRATFYLVSPVSLTSWFSYFSQVSGQDKVVHIGEGLELDPCEVAGKLAGADMAQVVVYSSHHTLVRDRRLADGLRVIGFDVASQSHLSVAIGADKLLMKRFLDRHGFATPKWSSAARRGIGARPVYQVVKARHGTQSENTRLATPGEQPATPDVFHEEYESGTEYSVIVYRNGGRTVTFPPVWKGRTSLDLVPPWRRLRLCPYHRLPESLATEMHRVSTAIATAADTWGYMEIEYLLTDNGELTVLELNPRVSGTMRLVAMATDVKLFSPHCLPELPGLVPAVRWAAEVPYEGEHFASPEDHVFATSRLTVASNDPTELRRKLVRFGSEQASLDAAAFQVA